MQTKRYGTETDKLQKDNYMDKIGDLFTVPLWDELKESGEESIDDGWCCKLLKYENLHEPIIAALAKDNQRCFLLALNFCPNNGEQLSEHKEDWLAEHECCKMIEQTKIESFQFFNEERNQFHNMINRYCINCGSPLNDAYKYNEQEDSECGNCGGCNFTGGNDRDDLFLD